MGVLELAPDSAEAELTVDKREAKPTPAEKPETVAVTLEITD